MSLPRTPLARALAERAVVLDGGLAHQLQAQGCDLADHLWSARLLLDAPEQLRAAHLAYLRAGARVLITASYQASRDGFARRGLAAAEADALLARSVTLARRAAAAVPEEVWVAASVGPYGAVLADGSEYRGRYGLPPRQLERFHRPRIEALAAAEPDVLALETVPDVEEAAAMLRAAEGCGVPVWLSYTVSGERTRAGQPLTEAFAVAAGCEKVVAVGVNCCTPQDATAAVAHAREVTGKPVVVYPNSGERWDASARSWRGGSQFDARQALAWRAAGARLIGGCCRVGPERIGELSALLAGDGPSAGGPPTDGPPADG